MGSNEDLLWDPMGSSGRWDPMGSDGILQTMGSNQNLQAMGSDETQWGPPEAPRNAPHLSCRPPGTQWGSDPRSRPTDRSVLPRSAPRTAPISIAAL